MSLPFGYLLAQLERYLTNDPDGAGVAREHRLRVKEVGVVGVDIVLVSAAVLLLKLFTSFTPKPLPGLLPGNVLGMVKNVGELRSKAEFNPLGDIQIFVNAKINIIGRPSWQGISSSSSQGTRSGRYVLSRRILRQVGHNSGRRVFFNGGDAAASARRASWVENCAITRAPVTIQVRIHKRLHMMPILETHRCKSD